MATANRSSQETAREEKSLFDPEGFPWLENGERMDQKTFHERYEQTPSGFKAELIGGVVYVASPLRIRHGRSDHLLTGWLFTYGLSTPGTDGQNNATIMLGEESEPQPDCALLILEEYGGQSRDGQDDYTHGAPELIVEVALSSRSIDLNKKLRDYEAAGVREYLVYDLRSARLKWFRLEDGRFVALEPDEYGVFRSQVFAGLWLDSKALIEKNKLALIGTLNQGLASPEHAAFVEELQRRKEAHSQSKLRERPE